MSAHVRSGFISGYDRSYVLGNPPNYEPDASASIASLAQTAGKKPAEYIYEAMLENDGGNLLYYPAFGYGKADIDVIDFERLQVHVPEVIYDLPAGGVVYSRALTVTSLPWSTAR